jgi:ABC-type phosphate/phosphonate transport system substrate-binding protein
MNTPLRRHLLAAAALLAACASALAAPCEQPERLGFSIIPRGDVKREIAQLQPLLDSLRAALGIPVEVYTPPSYGAVVEALQSGALVPKRSFAKQVGTGLETYFAQVGYSGSHTQSVNRLLAGQVDAAFVGSQNLAAYMAAETAAHPDKARQVRVIWRSDPIPADPFVMRGQLCAGVKDRIRDVFLRHGARNAAVLDRLDVVRFVPVSDRDYRIIRDSY